MTLNDLVTALESAVKTVPIDELSESMVKRIRLCVHDIEWRWCHNPATVKEPKENPPCTTTIAEKCCR